jgi:hypothetical protein
MRIFSAVVAILTLGTACTSTIGVHERTSPVTARSSVASSPVRGRQEIVALDELRRSEQGDLLNALKVTRPQFLNPRRAPQLHTQEAMLDVFLNGVRIGGAEELRRFPVEHVASVRFVRRSHAYVLHGHHLRGDAALFITTLR